MVDKNSLFCYDFSIMATPKKIMNFLEKSGVKFEEISHRKVYTATDKARTLKSKEDRVAKTVVIKVGKTPFITVIPANTILNIEKLKKIVESMLDKEVNKIGFASEKWIKENIKGMKEGAIPPFGSIWKIRVIADKNLLKNREIIVNSGSNTESVKMTSAAFKKAEPELKEAIFSRKKKKGV